MRSRLWLYKTRRLDRARAQSDTPQTVTIDTEVGGVATLGGHVLTESGEPLLVEEKNVES